jgi:hypothetical protein
MAETVALNLSVAGRLKMSFLCREIFYKKFTGAAAKRS